MNRRCVLFFFLFLAIRVAHADAQNTKIITGATLIDVAAGKAIPNAMIIIEGTKISQVGALDTASIPQNATRIDASGKFVIPGLADMHNHLQTGGMGGPENLKVNLSRLLMVGVTTVFDPSISRADFASLKGTAAPSSSYPYPNFFGTGPIITVEGDSFGAAVGALKPTTVAEAQSVVKDLKAAGVDALKLERDDLSWASSFRLPLMKADVMTAVIKEAHEQGLKVYVHAPLLEPAKEVLRAGADGLMHGIIDKAVDDEFIDLMKRNRAVYVPTLSLYEDVADVGGWIRRQSGFDQRKMFPSSVYDLMGSPAAVAQFATFMNNARFTKDHLPTARANVKKVADAGISIVLGTDTGFPGVMLGVSTQLELTLLVEAGLKPSDALRSATLEPARMLGREKELGTIEKDHLADLVILDANPLEDIRNVRRINLVIKGGVVVDLTR